MAIIIQSNDRFANRHALGIIRVYATSAGTGYVDLTPLFRIGQVNFGIQIQAVGSSVTPSFTMDPVELALDQVPARQAIVNWVAYAAVTAGNITVHNIGASAVKLVFAGAGAAYIGVF